MFATARRMQSGRKKPISRSDFGVVGRADLRRVPRGPADRGRGPVADEDMDVDVDVDLLERKAKAFGRLAAEIEQVDRTAFQPDEALV
jgi:hypothetical protein